MPEQDPVRRLWDAWEAMTEEQRQRIPTGFWDAMSGLMGVTLTPPTREPSNLEIHAERELRRAGMFDADSDYDGMLGEAVMNMVRAHSAAGHSGFSHYMAMQLFERVADFKPLTPLTNDPDEWQLIDEAMTAGDDRLWQSRRDPACFSDDGGRTYYSLDDDPPQWWKVLRRLSLVSAKRMHRAEVA